MPQRRLARDALAADLASRLATAPAGLWGAESKGLPSAPDLWNDNCYFIQAP